MKKYTRLHCSALVMISLLPLGAAIASTVGITGDQCCASQTCNGVYEEACTTIPSIGCVGCSGGGQCEPYHIPVWVALYNPCQ